jgi:uncharacterized membrane protein
MGRRRTVLGLPIGKKKPSVLPKAVAAGAGLAAVPALLVVKRSGTVSAGAGKVKAGVDKARQVADLAGKAEQVMGVMGDHTSTVGKIFAGAKEIGRLSGDHRGDRASGPKLSHLIEEHTDVAVPRPVAYNQWTQFELFPSIMKGAERVEQKGRDKVEWTAKIGPAHRSWQGLITEQVPDQRIAFRSNGGLDLKGVVTFHSLGDELTRVHVEMEYTPRGAVEQVGNLLRVQRRRVRRDLRLFKCFVELRGEETGAWRSRIARKDEGEKPSAKRSQGPSSAARAGRPSPAARTSRARAGRAGTSRATAVRASASRSTAAGGSPGRSNGTRQKATRGRTTTSSARRAPSAAGRTAAGRTAPTSRRTAAPARRKAG